MSCGNLLISRAGTWAIDQMGSKGTENHWCKFGSKLKPGNVIGCLLDLIEGTMSFYVDGHWYVGISVLH